MNLPGRMKLLLISLHFSSLCTLSSWSVSLNTQTADIDVFEGEAVNISCCWTGGRVRVVWFKNQKTYKNDSLFTDMNLKTHNNEMEKCSILNFASITKQDSGRYVCEILIEIPVFDKIRGNGTTITVKTRENQTNTTDQSEDSNSSNGLPVPIVASVAAVSLLLLITIACFCCLRKSRGHAARVIHESPYTNSDIMEMDNQSTTSSRGSSQWCQVPVYDSLDYFEHVEHKGSK
ncbi:uncharacterized protein LOC112156257 [Oryzias melastigma]|uniref:uncharacterized protein LOC112156257 n=1 Tax=Oryzias melastigma TaxID=30732 RepID=UPI000CF822EB|nr:uncharacterized protein LOC112156257 [Oryzias melastigma]